jgi:hypothetical protein
MFLKLHEGFNLFDSDGLRVTMAIGREYYSPDDVQSWWIPRGVVEELMRGEEPVIGWESFWVWSSETASQGIRKITAPPPGKQDPSGMLIDAPADALPSWRIREHTVQRVGRYHARCSRVHCCIRHPRHPAQDHCTRFKTVQD